MCIRDSLLADDTKLIDAATITSVATVEMSNVVASKMKDNMTYTATITDVYKRQVVLNRLNRAVSLNISTGSLGHNIFRCDAIK